MSKLIEKAMEIAKREVIKTRTHSYCAGIYKNEDGKLVIAMKLENGKYAACCINAVSEVKLQLAKERPSLQLADADLADYANMNGWPTVADGFFIYDELLISQGKEPQNQRQKTALATVEPKSAPAVPISLNLQSIAAHMDYRYAIIKNPSRAASRAVIEIGFLILLVKKELPHGELGKWIADNTKVGDTWAKLCRRAAEKFCEAHGEQALLTLCNPSADNAPEAVEQAEQLMMDFTKGVGPTALLHNLGIKKREGGGADDNPGLPEGETAEHADALHTWTELNKDLINWGLKKENWARLHKSERQTLYDTVHELDTRLRKSLKD